MSTGLLKCPKAVQSTPMASWILENQMFILQGPENNIFSWQDIWVSPSFTSLSMTLPWLKIFSWEWGLGGNQQASLCKDNGREVEVPCELLGSFSEIISQDPIPQSQMPCKIPSMPRLCSCLLALPILATLLAGPKTENQTQEPSSPWHCQEPEILISGSCYRCSTGLPAGITITSVNSQDFP